MKIILVLFFTFTSLKLAENAKILAMFPLQAKSHFIMFEPYLKGLLARGHEVDVVSHFPQKNPIPRYTDYILHGPSFVNNMSMLDIHDRDHFLFMLNECGIDICKGFFATDIATNLKNTRKKYDLFIGEVFTSDCLLGYAHIFKIPVIGLTSSINLPWASGMFGLPDNPSYIPNYFTPYISQMSLLERTYNTLSLLYTKTLYKFLASRTATELSREFFGPDVPDVEDLASNISLLLVNSHLSMQQARPMVPNVIEVGGLHIIKEKPLPKYFEDSLQENKNGVIYLSTGSMIMTESFHPHVLNELFSAFAELPYKVLWKANQTKFPMQKFPSNIQFETWMPQIDILCHPNVKLFVSHGGLLGTQEATYCGVPVLGIPVFADQELNLFATEKSGRGFLLNYQSITKANVKSLVKELLDNPKYKQNCELSSRMFKDRPMHPLDEAVYWTEYVLRYNGAPQLRTTGSRLPWYQYYLTDVTLLLISISLSIVFAIYVTLSRVLKAVFKSNPKQPKKHKKH